MLHNTHTITPAIQRATDLAAKAADRRDKALAKVDHAGTALNQAVADSYSAGAPVIRLAKALEVTDNTVKAKLKAAGVVLARKN